MTKVTTYICDFCGKEEKQVNDWVIGGDIISIIHNQNQYNANHGYTRTYAKGRDICPTCASELKDAFIKAYRDFLERRS